MEVVRKYAVMFGIESYSTLRTPELIAAAEDLIIQCDSLWKVGGQEFQTLVLDEINMVLERIYVCRDKNRVFATLVRLCKAAHRNGGLLVMDAYASVEALYFLEKCCGI